MYLTYFIALVPIAWLMVSLGILKMPGYKTCPATLGLTAILAVIVWKMPILDATSAALEGTALTLWPIILVIVLGVMAYFMAPVFGF